jgi:hypothetical protein
VPALILVVGFGVWLGPNIVFGWISRECDAQSLSESEVAELSCLMTTATTLLALLPVLTSTGRGSDIMVPMAIPSFGGMFIEIMTMLVVPVLYCSVQEWKLRLGIDDPRFAEHAGE